MANEPKTDLAFGEQYEPDVFWERHGKKIIAGGAVVLIVAGAAVLWQRNKAQQEERAAARLAAANDPSSLQAVVTDYAGQPAAATALLRLADLEFQNGRYSEAAVFYQRFLNQFARHPLVDSAHLGLAAAQEAQGNLEVAQTQYSQLASLRPTGYASLSARMGAARCSEMLGQTNQARQAYEEIMAAGQGSPWHAQAYMRWVALGQQSSIPSTNAAPSVAASDPAATAPVLP